MEKITKKFSRNTVKFSWVEWNSVVYGKIVIKNQIGQPLHQLTTTRYVKGIPEKFNSKRQTDAVGKCNSL